MASREYEAIRKRQAEDQMATTVQSMSRKVDMIFEHLGLEVPEDQGPQAPDEGEPPIVVEGAGPVETDQAYEKSDLPGGHLPRPGIDEETDQDTEPALDDDMPVGDLDLSEGIVKALDDEGIATVGDLRARMGQEDNPIPGIGDARRAKIMEVLGQAEESASE